MKVLITGATGLIGNKLVNLFIEKNISVNYLTTSKNKIKNDTLLKGFYWNPALAIIDENSIKGVEVIINLAGASISRRWTKKYKQEILNSRILPTNLLYKTLQKNPHQVKQVITASAIGIYPDSFENVYTEVFSKYDSTFLADVVLKWEQAVKQFENLNVSVCFLRIGLVLAKEGGALPKISQTIKMGLGASFGSGKQFQSWIHIDDLIQLFYFSMMSNLKGIFNATSPEPVTNKALNYKIAKILKKPFFMPNIPKLFLKIILGDMHSLLFESQNVSSKKIESNGFQFQYKNINLALEELLIKK